MEPRIQVCPAPERRNPAAGQCLHEPNAAELTMPGIGKEEPGSLPRAVPLTLGLQPSSARWEGESSSPGPAEADRAGGMSGPHLQSTGPGTNRKHSNDRAGVGKAGGHGEALPTPSRPLSPPILSLTHFSLSFCANL